MLTSLPADTISFINTNTIAELSGPKFKRSFKSQFEFESGYELKLKHESESESAYTYAFEITITCDHCASDHGVWVGCDANSNTYA